MQSSIAWRLGAGPLALAILLTAPAAHSADAVKGKQLMSLMRADEVVAGAMKAGLKNNDVIGIVKHALKFIDDRAGAETPTVTSAPASADATTKASSNHFVAASGSGTVKIRNVTGKAMAAIHFEPKNRNPPTSSMSMRCSPS